MFADGIAFAVLAREQGTIDWSPSEKDSPVYCIRTLGAVKPQPQVGPCDTVRVRRVR